MATVTKKKKKLKLRKIDTQEQHRVKLSRQYALPAHDVDLSTQVFRFTLLRGDAKVKTIQVDGLIETVKWKWAKGDAAMAGEVEFRLPRYGPRYEIHDGHLLRCQVRWGGKWRELWKMQLMTPDAGGKTLDDKWVFNLHDGAWVLQQNEYYWHFVKSKHRKQGWRCHEVVAAVAKQLGIPLGKVIQGKHRCPDIHGKLTAMEVIQKVMDHESKKTGSKYVIRWQNGKLNIVQPRYNGLMNVLSNQIQSAAIGRDGLDEKFATSVTVRAHSKHEKHIKVNYENKKALAQYGLIHREIDGGAVKDRAEALQKAKRYMLDHSIRKRTITQLQHAGIAFLRRGDAMRVDLPRFGFTRWHGLCFVVAGEWTLTSGTFVMNLDVSFDDPLWNKEREKDKIKRANKRIKRINKARGF